MSGMRGSGPLTVEVASAAQRERAVRLLWLAQEFDTATIAALLAIGEAEVAKIVATRDHDERGRDGRAADAGAVTWRRP